VPEETRTALFDELAEIMPWGPRTRATFWAATHVIARNLSLPISPLVAAVQKRLDKEKQRAPRWIPSPTSFADRNWGLQVCALDPEDQVELLSLLVAFSTGQRIGDILKIETARTNVNVSFPRLAPVHRMTLVTGKMIPIIGMSQETPFDDVFIRFVSNRMEPYLFLPLQELTMDENVLEKATTIAEARLHKILAQWDLDIDMRAVRRGGLSPMASSGFTNEQVQTISRHHSVAQLSGYLNHGAYEGGTATLHNAMTRSVWTLEDRPWETH
jgi:hypothetical protein